ncbi:hypothetical protein Btru_077795 [Bulinus truncatus]|nr:hypothetical protein Btru_077795 [Bulinus truncatus]
MGDYVWESSSHTCVPTSLPTKLMHGCLSLSVLNHNIQSFRRNSGINFMTFSGYSLFESKISDEQFERVYLPEQDR